MTRFNPKWGAALLIGLAALYMVVSLATRRSAASDKPPDLAALDAGLDVWKAAALLVRDGGRVAVIDVRPRERFEMYHLPGARNLPDANAAAVVSATGTAESLLLVADQDKDASLLVAEVSKQGRPQAHFLKDGVRAWYLAFELPVPLFSDKPSPHGWEDAMAVTRAWFAHGGGGDPGDVLTALGEPSPTSKI